MAEAAELVRTPDSQKGTTRSPMINRLPRAMLRSSDTEIIMRVRGEYQNAWQSEQWQWDKVFEAWRYYFGYDWEHWTEDAVRYKQDRHSRVSQYNIIKQKINTMTGMLTADTYDFRFDPVSGQRDSAVAGLEYAYYCDKEMYNFQHTYNQVIHDGIIFLGVIEPYISRKYDPIVGNIAYRRAIPGRWMFDPYWKSDSFADCRKGWKTGHLTISQMVEIFGELPESPLIPAELDKQTKEGFRWTRRAIDEYNRPFPSFTDAYQVIEYHEVQEVKKSRIIAMVENGQFVPFPVTEDNELLEQFAQAHRIDDWQENVLVVPYHDRVDYQYTICPELFPTAVVTMGKPEIQIRGLPCIPFTSDRDISGRNMGMVGLLKDMQDDINYSKSKIWEMLANSLGGGIVYNKDMLPDEQDQRDFEANRNDPTRAWGLHGNDHIRDFMDRISSAQISPDLIRQINESFDISDRVSGVSAAMSSETQHAGEPASLFAMKVDVNRIGVLNIVGRVKEFSRMVGEAYFEQAKVTYRDEEKTFTSKDGKRQTTLNEDMGDGTVRNSVSDIPRCTITITEASNNLTRRQRTRAELAGLLEVVPSEMREINAMILREAFVTADLSEDKKEEFERAVNLEILKARSASMAELSNTKAQDTQGQLTSLQLGQQLDQMLQQAGMGGPPALPEAISEQQASPDAENLPEQITPARGQALGSGDAMQPESPLAKGMMSKQIAEIYGPNRPVSMNRVQ